MRLLPDTQLDDVQPDEDTTLESSGVKGDPNVCHGQIPPSAIQRIDHDRDDEVHQISQTGTAKALIFINSMCKGRRRVLTEHEESVKRSAIDHSLRQSGIHSDKMKEHLSNVNQTSGHVKNLHDHGFQLNASAARAWNKVASSAAANKHPQIVRDLHDQAELISGHAHSASKLVDSFGSHSAADVSKVSKAGAAQMSGDAYYPIPEGRRAREYDNSFRRDAPGISGSHTPDLPEQGRDWPEGTDDHGLDRPPKNLVNAEENETKAVREILNRANSEAKKALAAAPRFSPGPFVSPPEREYLKTRGYSEEEISSGAATMSSRVRAEFNKWLTSTIRKSIARF